MAELSTAAVRRDRVDLRRAGLAAGSAEFLTADERRLRRVASVPTMMSSDEQMRGVKRKIKQSSLDNGGMDLGLTKGGLTKSCD